MFGFLKRRKNGPGIIGFGCGYGDGEKWARQNSHWVHTLVRRKKDGTLWCPTGDFTYPTPGGGVSYCFNAANLSLVRRAPRSGWLIDLNTRWVLQTGTWLYDFVRIDGKWMVEPALIQYTDLVPPSEIDPSYNDTLSEPHDLGGLGELEGRGDE